MLGKKIVSADQKGFILNLFNPNLLDIDNMKNPFLYILKRRNRFIKQYGVNPDIVVLTDKALSALCKHSVYFNGCTVFGMEIETGDRVEVKLKTTLIQPS